MTEHFNRKKETPLRRELRNEMPKAERLLWSHIRSKKLLGYKFGRQYSVGPYVLDFYCPAAKLAIELDGNSHYIGDAIEYDRQRQAYIEEFGIRVLRFMNSAIFEQRDGVLLKIQQVLMERTLAPPHPPELGELGD
jgi:very-short-patch-repair endonuclease